MAAGAPAGVAVGGRDGVRDGVFAVVEDGAVEGERIGLAVADLVDGDGFFGGPAWVEEVDGEGAFIAGPETVFHAEADVAVLVVGELFPEVGEGVAGGCVRGGGEGAGAGFEGVEGEGFCGRGEAGAEEEEGKRLGAQAGGRHGVNIAARGGAASWSERDGGVEGWVWAVNAGEDVVGGCRQRSCAFGAAG